MSTTMFAQLNEPSPVSLTTLQQEITRDHDSPSAPLDQVTVLAGARMGSCSHTNFTRDAPFHQVTVSADVCVGTVSTSDSSSPTNQGCDSRPAYKHVVAHASNDAVRANKRTARVRLGRSNTEAKLAAAYKQIASLEDQLASLRKTLRRETTKWACLCR